MGPTSDISDVDAESESDGPDPWSALSGVHPAVQVNPDSLVDATKFIEQALARSLRPLFLQVGASEIGAATEEQQKEDVQELDKRAESGR